MKLILNTFILLFAFHFSFAQEKSIVGQWKTIDDETGSAKSIVEITEENGQIVGKILKLFKKPEEDQNPKCDKCSGDKKDKPVIGMTILWDLKKKGDSNWADGQILDPKNGKTYSCKAELLEEGKKLKVRGFIGISLLGRSQVWEKQ